jgi:tetratricopeptide (TPR) repeat protein
MSNRSLPTVLSIALLACLLGAAGCGPTKAGIKARADAQGRMNAVGAQFTYDQAKQEFNAGQFDRAQRNIELAIERNPNSAQFEVLRGRIFLESHKLERAVDAFMTALEKDESCAEAHYYAGIVFQRWSDDEQAYTHYLGAYELEPDNVQYLLASAESLIALGEFGAARNLVEPKLSYFEYNAALQHLLGQIALLEGEVDEAARRYAEARMLDPENMALTEELAWVQFDAQQYSACLETVRFIQSRCAAQRSDLLHLEARCLSQLDRLTDAHGAYLELSRMTPADPTVWTEFGTVAWELGDYRRVAQCSVRAISIAPSNYEGYLLKGLYERRQGRLEEALRLFHQAAELSDVAVTPHLMLGRTCEEADLPAEAMKAYARALEIEPDNHEAGLLHAALKQRMYASVPTER